jgi:hypothetical protein
MSDRRIAAKSIERFGLLKPEPTIVPGRTLFVENCPHDFPPPLLARHYLRVAIQAGCEIMSIRRGLNRYEFKIQDMFPKQSIIAYSRANQLEALGPSALKAKLAGDDQDTVKGIEHQELVRPPWNQPEALDQGEKNAG